MKGEMVFQSIIGVKGLGTLGTGERILAMNLLVFKQLILGKSKKMMIIE